MKGFAILEGMSLGSHIQRWRIKRRLSMAEVEKGASMAPGSLESLEAGEMDPTASTLSAIAQVLGIPVSWFYGDPDHLETLMQDETEAELSHSVDPVTERILRAKRQGRELFFLLSALIEHGDPRLLMAAETNLRSLVKETHRSPIPWANRQPGNFDPPSD
ncbi:MAG: helix-turn-helix transcriptional regulator [Nitrospira sp.]|nr:helix-turn-helix transcriptional regulator [Nitrospira sp.]